MLASGIFFAGLGVSIRIAFREILTVEVVFFRNFINLIIMLPWLIKIGIAGLKTKKLSMQFFRAIGGLISMFFLVCWFWSSPSSRGYLSWLYCPPVCNPRSRVLLT